MDPNSITPIPPTEIPQQVPVQQVGVFKNSNKKKVIMIAAGVLMLILIVAVVAFFSVVVQKENKNTISLSPTPLVTSFPTPTTSISIKPALNETVDLKRDIVTKVNNTDITLSYVNSIIPSKNCADCISLTTINMVQKENKKSLDYSCGGIAGECVTSQEAFGYNVALVNQIDTTTMRVLVTRK